ncbi:phosphoglycolate phosphatase [Tepiditoga spiralis]|uniref:Phosphoglycolate phosphatase n=1 Tax=Tepiditoga spiralis TaxID=2108365 RepID=A0A7G1G303_9BACT|nr:HAD-IA family hydrolase [Tepiditoga spiralis]BBE30711.1 phosphoglycolate phosphatase [Tepiditoga spiralis]
MKYKGFIWDLGGTLFDTYPGMVFAFKKALLDYNIAEKDINILEKIRISKKTGIEYFKKKYNLKNEFIKNVELYEKKINLKDRPPFPYIIEVLKYINENGGKNFIFTHRNKESVFQLLNFYDLKKYFFEIKSIEDGLKRKPNKEGYEYFKKKYNLKWIAIGDREIDIQAGINCKIDTVYFNIFGEKNILAKYSIKHFKEFYRILNDL